jgi:tetratricopeptide (TPR) repeat protein
MTDGGHSVAGDRAGALLGCAHCSLLALSLVLPGCSHGVTPVEEHRSVAEQDLAADAFKHGRLREAYDHVQRALKLNPDNGDASYLGAMVLLGFCAVDDTSTDCRFRDAEAFARKAMEANPEMRDAKNTLGVILVHERRFDEAIAVLKPLTEDLVYVSPESAWGNLGWAYLQRGNTDEAIEALSRSVALQPLFCVGQYRLGLAYEKKGDLPLARAALTRALDTDLPQCKRLQDAYGARARVLARQGHDVEARADLARCRDMGAQTPTGQKCAALLAAGGDPQAPSPAGHGGGDSRIPGPVHQTYQ